MIPVYIHLFRKAPESATPPSGTMKTKELSKQVRDEVVEKYRSGLGYKKIYKTLNIPRSTVTSIIKKWKEYGTTTNLSRGPPTKTQGPGKEGINKRVNKEPKDNPEGAAKLHSGDWSICP